MKRFKMALMLMLALVALIQFPLFAEEAATSTDFWGQLWPVIISAVVLAILRFFTAPGKILGVWLKEKVSDIKSGPAKALIWGLVRFMEAKYPDLPGKEQFEKVLLEAERKFPGFPRDQLMDYIEDQWQLMKGEVLMRAPGK